MPTTYLKRNKVKDTISLGMVEDQHLFLNGMKALIRDWPEMQFVFESPNGYSVLERLSESEVVPEVMLLDLTLPPKGNEEFNGWQVLKELKTHHPQMKVIILSVHDDEYLIAQMIEQGAHGYLVKDSDPMEVRDAIHAVYEKGAYINTRTLQAIQGKMEGKVKTPKAHENLSKREVEVLQLICQQLTSEEIGEKLFISVKTVNGHRNNLLQKTHSRNVTGLVMYAVKHRLVEFV